MRLHIVAADQRVELRTLRSLEIHWDHVNGSKAFRSSNGTHGFIYEVGSIPIGEIDPV